MAARKNVGTKDKPWDDSVRSKIQTSMLVNRLTDFVKGEVKLDPAQVSAALGLLRKTLPDVAATTITHSGSIQISSKEQRDAAVAAASRADS